MRSTTPQTDRRKTQRRLPACGSDRRSDIVRAIDGDRREMEMRGIAQSMVDALDDILRYESRQKAS